VGELRADWTRISVEDAALIRQAVRENWPTENGEAILETLTSAVDPTGQPRRAVRLAQLLLRIDRHQLRRAAAEATPETQPASPASPSFESRSPRS